MRSRSFLAECLLVTPGFLVSETGVRRVSLVVVVGALSGELTGSVTALVESLVTIGSTVTSSDRHSYTTVSTVAAAAVSTAAVTTVSDSSGNANSSDTSVATTVTLLSDFVGTGLLSLIEAAGLVIETRSLVVGVGVRKPKTFLVAERFFCSRLFGTRGSVVVFEGALTLLTCGLIDTERFRIQHP